MQAWERGCGGLYCTSALWRSSTRLVLHQPPRHATSTPVSYPLSSSFISGTLIVTFSLSMKTYDSKNCGTLYTPPSQKHFETTPHLHVQCAGAAHSGYSIHGASRSSSFVQQPISYMDQNDMRPSHSCHGLSSGIWSVVGTLSPPAIV
jgi:hypothetical protein